MKRSTLWLLLAISVVYLISGCIDPAENSAPVNLPPKTFLWLYPDSGIAQGHSTQQIRWWGEDPDGLIKGFLIASGRIAIAKGQNSFSDTILWRFRIGYDSVLSFPLKTKRDTFQFVARAVDNSFKTKLPDQALVRFVKGATPYWDRNENGIFDAGDQHLITLSEAVDPKGASLALPVLNQPPAVVFAPNPNDPSRIMAQPDTTFTAATFAWVGTDPDGDATIANYDIALNDTTDPTRILSIGGTIKLVTLIVPRERSSQIVGQGEVSADVWSGTYQTSRKNLGQLGHLKMNSTNRFYVRARDIAGDVSSFARLPGDSTRNWYVKNPSGNVLIIEDYILSDSGAAVLFYKNMFDQAGLPNSYEVLNIGRGLSSQNKLEAQNGSKFGAMVPPFLDPAFLSTLHLFDVVCWFTDGYPSLPVAQYPLYEYTHDPSHRGKVIFSTTFLNSADPRGALTDFAPLDSVSSVNLNNSRLLPTLGDTQIRTADTQLDPDSERIADGFGTLKFNPSPAFQLLNLRPIYKRTDANYIYRIQSDPRSPIRYAQLATLDTLNSIIAPASGKLLTCGLTGSILLSTDDGSTWKKQVSGTQNDLYSLTVAGPNIFCVGDGGTIMQSNDGGTSWDAHSIFTFETLEHVDFVSSSNGYICGSTGTILHTGDAGVTWSFVLSKTNSNLQAIEFFDANHGVAVGDDGTTLQIQKVNGKDTCISKPKVTSRRLNSISYADENTVVGVGALGTVVRSTDGGSTWVSFAVPRDRFSALSPDLRSIQFDVNHTGWVSGQNGVLYQSSDAGASWVQVVKTGIEESAGNGQTLNASFFTGGQEGYLCGTNGIVLKSINGGSAWSIVPNGPIRIGAVDGIGTDGYRSFVFFGLPLHLLNGNTQNMQQFFKVVLHTEFGL